METKKIDWEGRFWGSLASARRWRKIESSQNSVPGFPGHQLFVGTGYFGKINGRMFVHKVFFSRIQIGMRDDLRSLTLYMNLLTCTASL